MIVLVLGAGHRLRSVPGYSGSGNNLGIARRHDGGPRGRPVWARTCAGRRETSQARPSITPSITKGRPSRSRFSAAHRDRRHAYPCCWPASSPSTPDLGAVSRLPIAIGVTLLAAADLAARPAVRSGLLLSARRQAHAFSSGIVRAGPKLLPLGHPGQRARTGHLGARSRARIVKHSRFPTLLSGLVFLRRAFRRRDRVPGGGASGREHPAAPAGSDFRPPGRLS